MKIYDAGTTGGAAESVRATETQRLDQEAGALKSGSTSSTSGDRVELSSAMGSLSRALTSYSGDRAAKVQALSAQYQSGQYQANALASSRGLVMEALSQGAQ